MSARHATIVSVVAGGAAAPVADAVAAAVGAALAAMGGRADRRVVLPPDPRPIAQALRRAWHDGSDLVVTVGGMTADAGDALRVGLGLAWDRVTVAPPEHERSHHLVGSVAVDIEGALALWVREDARASLSLPDAEAAAMAALERPELREPLLAFLQPS